MEECATAERGTAEYRATERNIGARQESQLTSWCALQCEKRESTCGDEALLDPLLSRLQRDQIAGLCAKAHGTEWLKKRSRDASNRWKVCGCITRGHNIRAIRCECATRCGAGGGDKEREECGGASDTWRTRHFSVPPAVRRVVLVAGCSSPTTRGGDRRRSIH